MRKLYLLLVVALALGITTVAFAAEGDSFTLTLAGQEGYEDVSGTATITENAGGGSTVVLELEGSPEGASHPAHFHAPGDCGASEPIVIPLTNVENGASTTEVDESAEEILNSGYYLNVHLSPEEIATIVACADDFEAQAEIPDEAPDTGAGGTAGGDNSLPVVGLLAVGAILVSSALRFGRARSR